MDNNNYRFETPEGDLLKIVKKEHIECKEVDLGFGDIVGVNGGTYVVKAYRHSEEGNVYILTSRFVYDNMNNIFEEEGVLSSSGKDLIDRITKRNKELEEQGRNERLPELAYWDKCNLSGRVHILVKEDKGYKLTQYRDDIYAERFEATIAMGP